MMNHTTAYQRTILQACHVSLFDMTVSGIIELPPPKHKSPLRHVNTTGAYHPFYANLQHVMPSAIDAMIGRGHRTRATMRISG